jgi:hypothetical protein
MISKQNHFYSLRILAVAFGVLALMTVTFLFMGFQVIPNKLDSEISESCVHHLKDKSYQIKQFLLENVNNSKLWVENHDNTFFDSKWFAISFYEHDGKEWILKDFKLNNVVMDIYKIAQSEYIKVDQSLIAPSPSSEQITMQESKVGGMTVLVLDIPNNITTLHSNHLIRITLFTDLFTSTLHSDEKCQLSLMDAKGNFLIQDNSIDETSFLKTLQNTSQTSGAAEISKSLFEDKEVYSYKILKNLHMLGFVKPDSNIFKASFLQISFVNFIAISLIILIALTILYQHFQRRVTALNTNIKRVLKKDYQLQFNLSASDELTDTEEEIAKLADELRKN